MQFPRLLGATSSPVPKPEANKEATILVPVSLDRLLDIEHRLTKVEFGMMIIGALGAASLTGIVLLFVTVAAKGIP